jgi:hypothetical protein
MQNSSQPLNNSVLTDVKHYPISITTTIKIKGRKLPQKPIQNPKERKKKPQNSREAKIRNILQKQRSRNPRHAYRGTHNELVPGRKQNTTILGSNY